MPIYRTYTFREIYSSRCAKVCCIQRYSFTFPSGLFCHLIIKYVPLSISHICYVSCPFRLPSLITIILSCVQGSAINNNGLSIGWLDLLTGSFQSLLITINYSAMANLPTSQIIRTRSILVLALRFTPLYSKSKSKLLYDWRFTANQFVLASNPLRPTTRLFFSWTPAVIVLM
jgi:hypothetical protein